MRLEIPIPEDLTDELLDFWFGIFGLNPDVTRGVFLGDEFEQNHNVLYMERRDGKVAGTCIMTTCRAIPSLACFGEVATDPAQRRSGIATDLCGQAVEGFRDSGGEAVFLGTGNGDAARVYYRHGWRFLAGGGAMANITSGDSPEEFLVSYFHETGSTSVRVASAAERVPMIPLIHTPHDWQVLDSNASGNIFSKRYVPQTSCNGLFPRYEAVRNGGRGEWFAAYTDDGRVVGLATARLTDGGSCKVDGFAHKRHMGAWPDLMRAATKWATDRAGGAHAVVCVEDEEKQAAFEALDFKLGAPAKPFVLGDREVGSVRMQLG